MIRGICVSQLRRHAIPAIKLLFCIAIMVASMSLLTPPVMLRSIYRKSFKTRPLFKDCERYPPKAIVIGVANSGTDTLRMYLHAHPGIVNAPVQTSPSPWEKTSVNFFDLHYEEGMNWYIKQMPCSKPDQMIIDHSPQYFQKDYVPKRVFMFNSTMRLILIVKEPISRTVSQYMEMKSERSRFDTSLESFLLDKSGKRVDRSDSAVSASSYYPYMRKWLKVFPLNQFYIVNDDRLEADPLEQLGELETFLGVDSYFNTDNVYFNKTRGGYCVKLYYKENEHQCAGVTKGRDLPQLSDTTYNLLKEYFDPLNDLLFDTIGKQFNWTTVKRDVPFSEEEEEDDDN